MIRFTLVISFVCNFLCFGMACSFPKFQFPDGHPSVILQWSCGYSKINCQVWTEVLSVSQCKIYYFSCSLISFPLRWQWSSFTAQVLKEEVEVDAAIICQFEQEHWKGRNSIISYPTMREQLCISMSEWMANGQSSGFRVLNIFGIPWTSVLHQSETFTEKVVYRLTITGNLFCVLQIWIVWKRKIRTRNKYWNQHLFK